MKFFRMIALFALVTVSLSIAFVPVSAQTSGGVLNIYSARHYGAIEVAFNQFTEDTGIQIRVSQGQPLDLLERLRAEGEYSPADLFLSIDAGTMMLAVNEGLIQPIDTAIVEDKLAEGEYDPNGYWFALSKRARSIVYNPATVDVSELSTYEQLADPMWKDRLCLRPGAHIYTISLVSSLIYNLGIEEAEKVVAGWVANNPMYINSDTRIIQTIEAGGCDVGLTNHYYLAREITANPDYPVKLFWANQETTGTFYNVNIVGVTTSALNIENAQTFIEYFSTVEGQSGELAGFPGSNYEYPTNPEAQLGEVIESLGEVKFDTDFALSEYGEYQQQAIDLINQVGYGLEETN